MRIAIAGINHETNTYCAEPTPLQAFFQARGERILAMHAEDSACGGALRAIAAAGATPVPILVATTQPSGTISADAYAALKDEIVRGLVAAAPLDGVWLDLHGAGVADGLFDLEGDLVRAVRAAVGPIPLAASFDLHGNVTADMLAVLDGAFACHHYPHVDLHEVAAEAVGLIVRMHRERIRTVSALCHLPLLMPTTTTFEGPGQAMLERLQAAEAAGAADGVIDVSWFHGFPYTDVPQVGSTIVVTVLAGPSAPARAQALADRLGGELWAAREQFRPQSLDAAAAVAAAQACTARPVVINETSDNPGGGAPGDGTHLLRAMLDAGLRNAAFGFIVDPQAAAAAHAAGVGATIRVELGGRTDTLHGPPLPLTARVKALHDGRLTMEAMMRGAPLNLGRLARLQVDGIDIVVASRRSQTFDRGPFLAVGIDVGALDFIALKSSNHFRAGFRTIAAAIVTADPPGLTTHHIEVFPRRHAQRRLWPVDPGATWPDA